MEDAELTYGERFTGSGFNPVESLAVASCNLRFIRTIDQLDELRKTSTSQEQKRLASIAITEAQTAQMWAYKALNWKD